MPRLHTSPASRHRSSASVVDVPAWHRIGLFGSLGIATIGLLASITTDELDLASFVYYVIATAFTAALWVLVHRFRPRWLLLAWPVMLLLGMLGASFAAPVAASLCMGSVVLGFLFAGLTQDRGVSLILLLPTALTFIRVNHTVPAEQITVRLGIALIVWSAVAELPAWLNDKLRSARADLERLAATDPLTGLANRRYWDAQLGRMLAADVPVAVLLVDLDHFKRFNDAHGHLAGDEMLIAFARVIEQIVPTGDVCARWGGEEFALALYDVDTAAQIAERIRHGVPLGQTCSIGLVVHRAGETLTDLMHRTDEALYRAKTAGRDRVVAA